jgi:hypothetical protein
MYIHAFAPAFGSVPNQGYKLEVNVNGCPLNHEKGVPAGPKLLEPAQYSLVVSLGKEHFSYFSATTSFFAQL